MKRFVYFVGAGPGDAELITVKGEKLLKKARIVVWAGSLVNPQLLKLCRRDAQIFDSSRLTLEQTSKILLRAHKEKRLCVRLHSGDASVFGAIREQIEVLKENGARFEVVPGVSSFCAAAAVLNTEYTVPGVSQSVIITRLQGRTPVPQKERLSLLASCGASTVVFLSADMIEKVADELIKGGSFSKKTPAAVVYKATWKDEQKIVRGTLEDIAKKSRAAKITKHALILAGDFLNNGFSPERNKSKLYDKNFSTGLRSASSDADDKISESARHNDADEPINQSARNGTGSTKAAEDVTCGTQSENQRTEHGGNQFAREERLCFSAIYIMSFSRAGNAVSDKIAEQSFLFGGSSASEKPNVFVLKANQTGKDFSARDFCKEAFSFARIQSESGGKRKLVLLVCVGAAGIATRLIAPFVKSKFSDPAVVCVDDASRFTIPILSGHIGRANDAAKVAAEIIGAQAIITTSTDANQKWAVDSWAERKGLAILNPEKIKIVSAKALEEKPIFFFTELNRDCKLFRDFGENLDSQICFTDDENRADVIISFKNRKAKKENALVLIAKVICVGIGCKKNAHSETLKKFVFLTLKKHNISPLAVKSVASIDIKQNEKALTDLAEKLDADLRFFSAEELNALSGDFSSSAFVKSVAGVDCVCERAALASSRTYGDGKIILRKQIDAKSKQATIALSEIDL